MSDLLDEESRDKYLGEMRFIRAFWYFRLIQFYGDVPLRSVSVQDPTNDDEVQLAATSKETIVLLVVLHSLICVRCICI